MRAIVIMPIMVSFCLILGCDAAEPEPPSLEDVAEEDEEAEEVFEERGHPLPCDDHCDCPFGFSCSNGTCWDYIEFSPTHIYSCVADCQCDAEKTGMTGMTCYYSSPTNAYGACYTPNCSLSFDAAVVQRGATTNLTVTSEFMPAGSYTLLYGTKDGVPDENGSRYNLTSGTFPIVNSPGLAGEYTREAVMYGPQNQLLCWTDPVTVEFLP